MSPYNFDRYIQKSVTFSENLPVNIIEKRKLILETKVWDLPMHPSSLSSLFNALGHRATFPIKTLEDRKNVTVAQFLPITNFMNRKKVTSKSEKDFLHILRGSGLDLDFMIAEEGTQGDLPLG